MYFYSNVYIQLYKIKIIMVKVKNKNNTFYTKLDLNILNKGQHRLFCSCINLPKK